MGSQPRLKPSDVWASRKGGDPSKPSAVIQNAFSPSEAEVAWAQQIVRAYEQNEGGVLLVDGKLIERPVITAARRTLAIAEAVQNEPHAAARPKGE